MNFKDWLMSPPKYGGKYDQRADALLGYMHPDSSGYGDPYYEPPSRESLKREFVNERLKENQNRQAQDTMGGEVKRQNKAAKNAYMQNAFGEPPVSLQTGRDLNTIVKNRQILDELSGTPKKGIMYGPLGRLPAVAGALGGASGVMGANDLRNDVQQSGPIAGYAKWLGMQTRQPTEGYE